MAGRHAGLELFSISECRQHTPTTYSISRLRPYGFNVPYRKLFEHFEDIVSRHYGRPHWAKAHHMRPRTLRKLYSRFDDFISVLEEVDPNGMFRNEYIQRHIFGKEGHDRVFKAFASSCT
jgi:L-gulonolactone oxidase